MPKAVGVLPADLGEPEPPDVFPLRERLRFRDNLGLGLRDVRQRPTFATLPRGPWLVFIAVACYWQSNAEAWRSQETIAGFSGYAARAVRDYVEALERVGIVRLRRERQPNGSERIYYAPGSITLAELAAFMERGRRRARAEEREARRRTEADRGAASPVRVRAARVDVPARPSSREDLAKTRAEFEELAASTAPPFRGYLESLAARYRDLERKTE